MSILAREQRIEVLAHLVEGTGIRSTARLCKVSKTTVNKLALDLGEGCVALHDELMRDLRVPLVQVDEQWSYVKKKAKHVDADDDVETVGDQWTYVAQDVVHRAVISFVVGKRTAATARVFALDLKKRVPGRFQVTSDGLKAYVNIFAEIFGNDIDFAQLVKLYSHDEREARGQRPGAKRYIGSELTRISGVPKFEHVSTSGVERTHLSTRMEQARFARKTLRHSKLLRHHQAAATLYYTYFNLCRRHETLATTPAVALGVATKEWTLGELIDAAMARRPRVKVVDSDSGGDLGIPGVDDGELADLEHPARILQPNFELIVGGKS